MTVIFPPQFRDFPRVDLEWHLSNKLSGAVIDGFTGSYASMVGGETITLNANGAGNTIITFQASDTTIGAIINRINAAGSFATAGPGNTPLAAVGPNSGRIRLKASTSIAIVAHSGRSAFVNTGLQIMSRSIASAASTVFTIPSAAAPDRIDLISDNKLEIPTGSNVIGVKTSITPKDTSFGNNVMAQLLYFWELEDGSGVNITTSVLNGVINGTVNQVNVVVDTSNRPFVGYINASEVNYLSVGAGDGSFSYQRLHHIVIPPGAIALKIGLANQTDITGPNSDSTNQAATAPDISVSLWPGAR